MTLTVLSLCDRTGNMLRPWAAAGYRCVAVDTQHPKKGKSEGGIEYIHADVRNYLPPRTEYAACFAFPPCTDLAVSGARWYAEKGLAALYDAIGLVEACRRICEWTDAPYFLENPVSTLSTYWRKLDYTFNPCDFGGYISPETDNYTKKTCLWIGNGFIMPGPLRVVPTEGSKIHLMPPSPDRANLRSETPVGFAQAVFEANSRKESIA